MNIKIFLEGRAPAEDFKAGCHGPTCHGLVVRQHRGSTRLRHPALVQALSSLRSLLDPKIG